MKAWFRGRRCNGRILSPLSWSVGALGLALAAHLPYFPIWITALAFGSGLLRIQIERHRWRLLPPIIRAIFALICFIAILATYRGINGVVPGTALLAVMAAMKLLETFRRRDLYVVLFIACFLLLSALLRQQAIWSFAFLLVSLFVTMLAWLNVARAGSSLAPRTSIRFTLRIFAHAAPLLLIFWVLFPRVPGPFWAIPADRSTASTGISDTISPGSISKLSQSDAIAFRVQFSGQEPAARDLYWRGPVMESLNGRDWSVYTPKSKQRSDPAQLETRGQPTRYTMTLLPTKRRWLFALDLPRRWDLSQVNLGPEQQLLATNPVRRLTRVQIESYTDFQIKQPLSAAQKTRLTQTPANSNPRTRQLANELQQAYPDERQRSQAILDLFRDDNFVYTLEPPELGRDSMDEFLFETRQGFCEHYAAAYAYLMRLTGTPARLVGGYQGGEQNSLSNYFIVRQSNAHAWTEVWFEDDGWVRVDPTAAVSEQRIEFGLQAAFGDAGSRFFSGNLTENIQLAWDALNARWDDWILGYGPQTQERFMQWLGLDDPSWQKLASMMGIACLLSLVGIAILLSRRYRKPPLDAIEAIYRKTLQKLKIDMPGSATPEDILPVAKQLHPQLSPQLEAFFQHYQSLRFAGVGKVEDLRAQSRHLLAQS